MRAGLQKQGEPQQASGRKQLPLIKTAQIVGHRPFNTMPRNTYVKWMLALTLVSTGIAQNQMPSPVQTNPPQYPFEMSQHGIGGAVEVWFVIGPEGTVTQAKILRSTNSGFNQAAEAAVRKWQFKPGLRNGQPAAVQAKQTLGFSLGATPTYPYDLLVGEIEGRATVEFSTDENGRAYGLTVIEASQPEFGKALVAEIAASTFAPPFDDNKVSAKGLRTSRNYALKGKDGTLDQAGVLLLRRCKSGPAIPAESSLDKPLVLKKSPPPRLAPDKAAELGTGSAVLEVCVDEDGKVYLPRIDSATAEEFGYAAAQAVREWQYEPPRIHGEPAVVRARVHVEFPVPESK